MARKADVAGSVDQKTRFAFAAGSLVGIGLISRIGQIGPVRGAAEKSPDAFPGMRYHALAALH